MRHLLRDDVLAGQRTAALGTLLPYEVLSPNGCNQPIADGPVRQAALKRVPSSAARS